MTQEKAQKTIYLTHNKEMVKLISQVKQVAQTGCTALLITGENGIGKEVMARYFIITDLVKINR